MINFNEKYHPENFLYFLRDFLPSDFTEKEEDIIIKKDRYKEITKAKILGFCESLDAHVLEMDHDHENDPRVTIATDAFKILADHWIHRALVIFKNKDSENYRFSYLTISLDQNDKNKIVKKYSNARRYSFYLGANAKIRTPEQQLTKKGKIKDAEDLLNRFSVEVVNKQFYLEVAKFFDELVSGKDQNLTLPSISQDDANTRKSFAVRLIGRIMFCWFLKQKKSDNGQLIPDELLSSKIVSDNYYHNTLEPLFFGVLNTAIDSRDIRSDLFDKVPYLNGGLFNPQDDDYYELDRGTFASKHINTLKIKDVWFKNFFGLLETYNFTIDENTVFDQELSVDPEMLGRIFENLLAEINPGTGSSERKRTGSFYTPRQIVEYMIDQSIIEYLKTKTKIDDKKLSALASYDLTDDAEYPLEDNEKQEIISAIESLKILDPACGSGAYPIGALQKIVYILQQIDPDCKLWLEQKLKDVPELYKQKIIEEVKSNPFDYTRKLDVIKNSIFGVDIQPIAVDVSRLRCFLTLIVESEIDDTKPNRGIEPLPNLDFKFVCANTLIGLPKSENAGLFDDHSGIAELSKIMSEYFSCNNQRKNEIKLKFINVQKEILEKTVSAFGKNTGELTLRLTTWNPFSNQSNSWFDPEWMFGLQEKFDIVIGNPPYVQIKQIPNYDKIIFKNLYESAVGRFNLFYFFIELVGSLAKKQGIVSFIVPDRLLLNTQCKELRNWLLNKKTILEIAAFDESVFDSAIVDSIILIYKNEPRVSRFVKVKNRVNIGNINKNLAHLIPVEYFTNSPSQQFDLNYNKKDNELINKITEKTISLGKISETKDGIIQGKVADKLFLKTPIDSDSKRLLFGEDIQRYKLIFNDNWVNYKPEEMMALEVRRRGNGVRHGLWLRNPEIFERNKILTRQTADEIIATIDDDNYYYSNTLHGTTITDSKYDPRYVLGLLNSKLMTFYYRKITAESGKVFAQIKIEILRKLPIKIADISRQEQIVNLVDKINSSGIEKSDVENQINEAVMDLYELNEEEKEIIRKS